MRAAIIGELERKFNSRFYNAARKTIADNQFEGTVVAASWLEGLFAEKINGKKSFRIFENAISNNIKPILDRGDEYYVTLFRQKGFITDDTVDKELNNPFTTVVKAIYNSLFKSSRGYIEGLTIYSELRLHLEKKIGILLGGNKKFQSFKTWLKIYEKLEVEHDIYRAWIESIPLKSIAGEKRNFALIKKPDLNELAHLRGYRTNNKAEAKNYIAHLQKLSAKPVFDFITEVTRSSDLLTLKSKPELQLTLVKKLPVREQVLFIDSLHFPNLQDHAFLAITDLSYYPEVIAEIIKNRHLKTPKQHLLLIALENYFDFISRTATDLHGLSQRGYYDEKSEEIQQLKKEAAQEYEKWLKDYIPSSFKQIVNAIFPDAELSQSKYFLLFFEWINSHSKLYLVHRGNESKKSIIDLQNDLLLERLGNNQTDKCFLVDNLQKSQVNYETLRKLISVYEENSEDLSFRDKLYNIYVNFISAENFSWHTSENVDFEEALNNSYYFSQIFCAYEDGYEKWETLFKQYKTNHEGWSFTYADYKIYQRESFLLTAGIGMAYHKYSKANNNAASNFKKVFDKVIQQHRNAGESRSVDYFTPLKFAAITIGRYYPGYSEDFLKQVSMSFDGLKYILIAIAELKEYNKELALSDGFKKNIQERIANEFWIIEKRKSDLVLKQSLDYYKTLKETVLEILR